MSSHSIRRRIGILLLALAFGVSACGGEFLPLANAGKLGLQARSIDDLLTLETDQIDIGTAGLVFSHELNPAVDIEGLQESLDILADMLRERLTPEMSPELQAWTLIEFLAQKRGYRACDDAWQPGAQDLASMMDSKEGNCVGLTTIYLALGERVGWNLRAVRSPRHVYAVLQSGTEQVFIEPTASSYSTEGPPGSLWFDSEEQRDGGLFGQAVQADAMLAVMLTSHLHDLLQLGEEEDSAEYETEALELARHVVRLDPSHGIGWANIQACLSQLSRKQGSSTLKEQRECLSKARNLEPDRADYWGRSAQMENSQEAWAAARTFSERAIQLEPNMPVHYLPLSVALWGQEEHEAAIQALHRAREFHWTQIHPIRRSMLSVNYADRDEFDVQALRLLSEIYGDAADKIAAGHHAPLRARLELDLEAKYDFTALSGISLSLSLSELIRTEEPKQAKQYLQLFAIGNSEDSKSTDLARLEQELRELLGRIESEEQ